MSDRWPRVQVGVLPFARTTRSALEDAVVNGLREGRGGWILAANLDVLRQCTEDDNLRELALRADEIVADGMPLVWASQLRGAPLPERVAGSDLISTLSERLAADARSVYLLGGSEGSASLAAMRLGDRYPGLRIAGTGTPPWGFEDDEARTRAIIDEVVAAKPDLVFVGLGFPKQDRLIVRLRAAMPNSWFLGVGVSIDFVAGRVSRAPRWTHALGLEWVYRLSQEPRKLFRRYLVLGIPFALRLLFRACGTRVQASFARRCNAC